MYWVLFEDYDCFEVVLGKYNLFEDVNYLDVGFENWIEFLMVGWFD